ncbi:hypothetical protein PQQ52_33320, partial [Paraburkholderia sediminicola]|uniref:hypothetical protein n=1 Tax=Paraburkholderia sediminicola TaxID=458836 RepID=UPI0038B93AEC
SFMALYPSTHRCYAQHLLCVRLTQHGVPGTANLQMQGLCGERRTERSIAHLLNKNSFPTLWIVF